MVKDRQVQRLWKLVGGAKSLVVASVSSNMDRKTGRTYRKSGKRPSELAAAQTWRTRPDPFAEAWAQVSEQIEAAPGWQAKTLCVCRERL